MLRHYLGRIAEGGGTFWRVWMLADRIHLGLISAGVAFFGMFSLFPALSALIAIFGLVADPGVVLTQIQLLEEFVPAEAYRALYSQVERLLSARTGTLGLTTFLSLIVALWSARAAVEALMRGLNSIYDRPLRAGLRHMGVAILMTLSLIGVALSALVLVVIVPVVLNNLPVQWETAALLEAIRWTIALLVLIAGLGILYRFGPNRRGQRPGWFTPGAVVVILLWLVASWGFSFYLSNFGKYNEVYGSIGAAIAMLMWLYISAYLILFGAALNVVIEGRGRWGKVARMNPEALTERDDALGPGPEVNPGPPVP